MPETLEYASVPANKSRLRSGWLICVALVFGIVIVMWGLLTSSLARDRDHRRMNCCANLKAIATGCLVYAESHQGQLPPDLNTLLQGGQRAFLQPKQLVCPSSGGGYIYIPGQRNNIDPRNIVVFELPSNHKGEGGNVGYLDGHALWRVPATLASEIQSTLDEVILKRFRAD